MTDHKAVDYRFKILYAIAMITVVCGHIPGGVISIISDWFPSFGINLAAFAFGAGYFYKSSAEDTVIKYVLKKMRTLILPLYVYNIAYGLIVQALRCKDFHIGGDFTLYNIVVAPITNGHQFIYNLGGWFVVPLFMVQVFNVFLRKALKLFYEHLSEWVFWGISVVLGILGNQLACMGCLENGWLVLIRMLYFMPFYSLGILYRNKLENYDRKIPSFWYLCSVFALKLIAICVCGKMPMYTISWCNDFTDGPIMPIVVGYLGIALWMRIAIIMEPVIGKSKWINLIADNTYSIMMNQFLGFMIVKTIFGSINKIGLGFSDFDWSSYKNDVFWYYAPLNLSYTLIIYVVAGLAFPILFQKIIKRLLQMSRNVTHRT